LTVHDEIIDLADGKVFALVNVYELDGRPSSHPIEARGYSSMNCYLLVEDDRAVLVNTGYSVHDVALGAQLETLVGSRTIDLALPRVEFPSFCNARSIADRFSVGVVWIRLSYDAPILLNFRPDLGGPARGLARTETRRISTRDVIPVGSGGRELELFAPKLRLLPCSWAYDRATGTLFSGEIFTWLRRDKPTGPWLTSSTEEATTSGQVEEFLLGNRFWWLAGADTDPLRSDMAAIFDEFDVETIAPDHGPIVRGRAAIAQQLAALDGALESAKQRSPRGLDVDRWRFKVAS
jgi:hypothetical protein